MTISGSRAAFLWALVGLCLIAANTTWQVALATRAPIPAQYDYDEGVYAATADAFARGDRLYTEVFLSQPPLLIVMIGGMFHLIGTSLATARSTIALSSAIWLLAMLTILSARGRRWGGVLAVCLLLGRSAFLIKAHTVEMELPSEALACAALALAALGTRRPGIVWWVAAGGVALLAAMTKLTAIACLIPIAGATMVERRLVLARRWGAAAGGILALVMCLPIISTVGFRDQVFTFHILLARNIHQAPSAHVMAIVRFLAEEWPLSASAAVGIWWSIRRGGWLERALVVWLAVDSAGLMALTPLWEHHLLILFSPLALLAGIALDRIAIWIAAGAQAVRRRVGATVAVGAIAYLALGVSAIPPAPSSAELHRVVTQLTKVLPPEGEILTDDPMVAFLAHRRVAAGLIDTSLARIWTGEISEARLTLALRQEKTGAVVFWRGTFRRFFPRLELAAASLFPFEVRARGGRVVLLKRLAASHGP